MLISSISRESSTVAYATCGFGIIRDMEVALLHYWLTNVRGGEKVLAALGEMFPEADVFTHAYVPGNMEGMFDGRKMTESFIARLPLGRSHPQAYLPLMPAASRSLKLDGYDLIVSSESGPIKGIRKPKGARHVCYCHTPMRYLWDMHDEYYRTAGICGKLAMSLFTGYLRKEDLKSADSVDRFVANSAFVAERIKRIYGRDSVVVHPPVDVEFFSGADGRTGGLPFGGEYYLYVGELRDYKRPDLAVKAAARTNRNLVVVGNGRLRNALERDVGGRGNVLFAGRKVGDELRSLYAGAKALLFPGIEDFGIVPVEAQAAGTPVVALGRGGALETVRDGETGLFFSEASVESLCGAIEEFESRNWSPDACRSSASRFAKGRFTDGMSKAVESFLR